MVIFSRLTILTTNFPNSLVLIINFGINSKIISHEVNNPSPFEGTELIAPCSAVYIHDYIF